MMVKESLFEICELPLQSIQSKSRIQVFEELLRSAIDEYFSSLGESCKDTIYLHLKERHNIKRADIPSRIEEFAAAIEDSFGQSGKLIEIGIIKALYGKTKYFKYVPDQEDLSFIRYLEALKHFL